MSDKAAWLGFYNQYVSCEYRSLAKLSKYVGISMKLLNKIFKFHNFVKMPKGNKKQDNMDELKRIVDKEMRRYYGF